MQFNGTKLPSPPHITVTHWKEIVSTMIYTNNFYNISTFAEIHKLVREKSARKTQEGIAVHASSDKRKLGLNADLFI